MRLSLRGGFTLELHFPWSCFITKTLVGCANDDKEASLDQKLYGHSYTESIRGNLVKTDAVYNIVSMIISRCGCTSI